MDASFVDINNDMYVYATYMMDDSIMIADGVDLYAPNISVLGSYTIENFGTITGDINVCAGCQLTIHNMGVFNATFDLESGASIVQVVSSPTDMQSINFNTDYDLHVINAEGLSLSGILAFGADADSILLRDSFVVWDVYDVNLDKLNLDGNIKIKIDNIDVYADVPILSDVPDNVNVRIITNESNPLFVVRTHVVDNNLYITRVRETDYTKILSNDVGVFVNSLRDDGTAASLTGALDNATTMGAINNIVQNSGRLSPINLMKPIRMLNDFETLNFNPDVGIGADYLFADEFYVTGLNLTLGTGTDNFNFGFRMYLDYIMATDSFDEFSASVLGMTAYGDYRMHDIVVRGALGANMSVFDMDNVFDGNGASDNPYGFSCYGAMDVGYLFDADNNIYLMPYVGVATEYMKILNDNDSALTMRGGLDIGYRFSVLGILYDYSAYANMDMDGDVVAGVRVGFMSDIDMIGGHGEIGFVDNEIGRGYKITAGIDFKF